MSLIVGAYLHRVHKIRVLLSTLGQVINGPNIADDMGWIVRTHDLSVGECVAHPVYLFNKLPEAH